MFTLNPLAAALQGIGYGSLLTGLQGLWAETIIPPLQGAGPVITRAHLQRMRARREALRNQAPARDEKTRRQLDEEADELERFKVGVAALQLATQQRAQAERQAAEQAHAAIEQAQRKATRRRRQQQELLLLLS